MIWLTLLLLLGIVAVYAVFFLVFKLIWILIKKEGNKWPLIWAGICTVLFGIFISAVTAWGVYKVVSPFRGMMNRYSANPAPVFGEHVYTDPLYRFQLDVFDGMDFSEWMEWDDVDVKLGVDTNVFKTDADRPTQDGSMLAAVLLRQNDIDVNEEHPLEDLRQWLVSAGNSRSVQILSQEDFTVNGLPAMFITAQAFGNRGEVIPVWMTAMAAPHGQVFFVATFVVQQTGQDNEEAAAKAKQMALSLRLENGEALPLPATEPLPEEK